MAANDFTDSNTNWEDIVTVDITTGQFVVELSNQADGRVIADAVRMERIGNAGDSQVVIPWTVSRPSESIWG